MLDTLAKKQRIEVCLCYIIYSCIYTTRIQVQSILYAISIPTYSHHTTNLLHYALLPKSEKDQLVKIRVTPRASASTSDILLLLPILAKPLLMAPRSAQVCLLRKHVSIFVCIYTYSNLDMPHCI